MSILSKLMDFFGGSLFKDIKDGVMQYFPPDMTPQEKALAELKVEQFLLRKQIVAEQILMRSAAQLDKRIAEQEGTAKDLRAVPILGSIILLARGAQRPIWGFATLWMDNQWFFGAFEDFSSKQETALIVINILVLGFLFGERAVQNLTPLIIQVFGKVPVEDKKDDSKKL